MVGVTVVVITDVVIGVVATEGFKIGSSKMLLDEDISITKMELLSDFFGSIFINGLVHSNWNMITNFERLQIIKLQGKISM